MKTQALLTAMVAFPSLGLADFKGGDTFATFLPSNWYFQSVGGADFLSQNSRLEFIVDSPASNNEASLAWLRNVGGFSQSWFIQVDVSMGTVELPNENDVMDLSLGVFPSGDDGFRVIDIGMKQIRINGVVDRGISVLDTRSYYQEKRTGAASATLRLHHDKESRTITPSWNTGKGWEYGGPRDVIAWNMKASESFIALVSARNRVTDAGDAKVVSGQAWFKNFQTGNASPDIVVERSPSSELKDKKGIVQFGAAKTRVGTVIKTFKIRNHGTAELRGLNPSVLGADAGDFLVSKPARDKLAPGATTTFKISFRPRKSGLKKATIFLTSTDPDESSFEIKVSGRGVD